MNELMEKLLVKMQEHMTCCLHLNMRGIGEAKKEIVEILIEMKKNNISFNQFVSWIEEKFKYKVEIEKDKTLQMVKEILELEV